MSSRAKLDAPVTIVEYASMTCTHCAAFHAETYPTLQSKYIEHGQGEVHSAGISAGRAGGGGLHDRALHGRQAHWQWSTCCSHSRRTGPFVPKPVDALEGIVKQAGMSSDVFKKCLDDRAMYQKVLDVRQRANDKFGITSTPTFFINGTRATGEMPPDAIAKLIDPLLPK